MQTELQRQQEAYKAMRARMANPSVTVKRADLDKANARIAELEQKCASLAMENEKLGRELDDAWKMSSSLKTRIDALDDIGAGEDRYSIGQILCGVLAGQSLVKVSDILGKRRTRRIVELRQTCHAVANYLRPDLSLPALGRIFNRDHTVIIHSKKVCAARGIVKCRADALRFVENAAANGARTQFIDNTEGNQGSMF